MRGMRWGQVRIIIPPAVPCECVFGCVVQWCAAESPRNKVLPAKLQPREAINKCCDDNIQLQTGNWLSVAIFTVKNCELVLKKNSLFKISNLLILFQTNSKNIRQILKDANREASGIQLL